MTTKILSLDWDYFPDVPQKTRSLCFPDGLSEYNMDFTNFIWGKYYQEECIDRLMDVDVDENFEYVKDYLRNLDLSNTLFASSSSHLSIVPMVNEYNISGDIELINIDYHHDTYDNANMQDNELDCGNWITFLRKNNNVEVTWIKREHSMMPNEDKRLNIEMNIKTIKDFKPDYIFLSKSYPWSPPHLDEKFMELFQIMHFSCKNSVTFDYDVIKDRMSDVEKQAKQLKQVTEEARGG